MTIGDDVITLAAAQSGSKGRTFLFESGELSKQYHAGPSPGIFDAIKRMILCW
jgi:hypothetical protein